MSARILMAACLAPPAGYEIGTASLPMPGFIGGADLEQQHLSLRDMSGLHLQPTNSGGVKERKMSHVCCLSGSTCEKT